MCTVVIAGGTGGGVYGPPRFHFGPSDFLDHKKLNYIGWNCFSIVFLVQPAEKSRLVHNCSYVKF